MFFQGGHEILPPKQDSVETLATFAGSAKENGGTLVLGDSTHFHGCEYFATMGRPFLSTSRQYQDGVFFADGTGRLLAGGFFLKQLAGGEAQDVAFVNSTPPLQRLAGCQIAPGVVICSLFPLAPPARDRARPCALSAPRHSLPQHPAVASLALVLTSMFGLR